MNGNDQASHIDRELAQHIVRRMGETGQPPERGALKVNVGTDTILEALRREYLEPIRATGSNSTFKLVQGPFGGGKSHFLYCFREIAWKEGFATSVVGVSPRECPFYDMRRVYQRVAQTIELPPDHELTEPDPGIDVVLRSVIEARRSQAGEGELVDWLRGEARSARIESHAWRKAAFSFMEAVLLRRQEQADLLGDWLRGSDVRANEVAPFGIRETLEDSNAFRWLRSLVQFLRVIEIPGVVLMFDELDRALSLPRRNRREIGDNLRQLIDSCGQSILPGAVMLYAVPPEFMTHLVPEYPALEQRLRGPTTFTPVAPTAPVIDLDRLPLGPVELLRAIGEKLLDLYRVAYPEASFDARLQKKHLSALAQLIGENQLEIGSRRVFVRAAITLLAEQHRGGQRELTPEELQRYAGSAASEAPPLEGEEVF